MALANLEALAERAKYLAITDRTSEPLAMPEQPIADCTSNSQAKILGITDSTSNPECDSSTAANCANPKFAHIFHL